MFLAPSGITPLTLSIGGREMPLDKERELFDLISDVVK